MALKKSEIYSSLWASCDELRGGMDASQYKDYVLVLLFVKYVSDRYAGQPYAPITIPKGASFADMVALKGKPDIGDRINKQILGPLAQANHLADMPDFNDPGKLGSGKELVERLTNLIAIFESPALDFSKNRADGDDLLGDAYEYLMRHFATESGKSKGQFYTPAEVSRVIARILGIRHAKVTSRTSVYDPTCGSGSLLLKVADEATHGRNVQVTLYGQEKDNATAGLARMNMILHGYPTAQVEQGNTLANPKFLDGDALKTFDYVVANPPFSDKRWSTGLDPEHDAHNRFKPYGIPTAKQGDYAYLLHILRSMKGTAKGACILPHGVLFRGGAEADPKSDYNLNLPRYIDSSEPEDLQDIDGHLRGGIPDHDLDALEGYWRVIPSVRTALFESAGRPGYSQLKLPISEVKPTILGHPEFAAFERSITSLFNRWKERNRPRIQALKKGDHPKALIETLAEDLLASFEKAGLMDPYDIYQHLMDYWAETMQDDVYLIVSDSWREAAQPRLIVEDRTKKTKARPNFAVGKKKYLAELVPPALVIRRWFAVDQAPIEALEAEVASLEQQLEEIAEEHGGEDGLLADARNEKDKLTRASVAARLREVKVDAEAADERQALEAYLALLDREAAAADRLTSAQNALTEKVAAKYPKLTENEIKTVVVDDRWLADLGTTVRGELERTPHALAARIRQLAERYAMPLPELNGELAELAARVDVHLKSRGAAWH